MKLTKNQKSKLFQFKNLKLDRKVANSYKQHEFNQIEPLA